MPVTPTDDSATRAPERTLRVLGHEVLGKAISAGELADAIAGEDPDLAIVRLHRDEDHALGLIQQSVEYASGPVIVLLDEDDTDFIPLAAEEGIDAFAQPVTRGTVQGTIEVAMRRHAEIEALGEKVSQLETALERRAIIERAKGILMERHGVDDTAAFELLRSNSRASNRKVVDLAAAVADGHALLPGR